MVRHVILRVWVDDRPGSLGRLATRLGELHCDLIGIDVLEQEGDRAIDELTVEMPEGLSLDALVAGVAPLSGVEVEDVRYLVSRLPHAERDPLEAAVTLASCAEADHLPGTLARVSCAAFAGDWSAVLDTVGGSTSVMTVAGEPPNSQWLAGFVGGVTVLEGGGSIGPRDVAWGTLDSSDLVVVVGRDGPPFRARERQQLQQLCRIADARWVDLVCRADVRPRLHERRPDRSPAAS